MRFILTAMVFLALSVVATCKTLAIFVGCTYEMGAHHFPKLEMTVKDVSLVQDVLSFDADDSVTLLSAPGHSVSKKMIYEAVNKVSQRCSSTDTFVFFFSGHGTSSRGGYSLLVPEDSTPDDFDPDNQFIPVGNLERKIGELCPAATKILILDACASGGSLSVADETALKGHGFVVLAASGADGVAYPLADHSYSAFTYAFARAVKDLSPTSHDITECNVSKLAETVDSELSEVCKESRLQPQRGVYRFDQDKPINEETFVQQSKPMPEVITGVKRPLIDTNFLERLKKGIGVVFVSDNADLSASASSAMRSMLLQQGQYVFGPERSADLSNIIDAASSIEKSHFNDLTSRFLIRGKIKYEVTDETVDSIPLHRVSISIQVSLLDLLGNILAEQSSDVDGDPVVMAASSRDIALQRALHKALERIRPIIDQAVSQAKE